MKANDSKGTMENRRRPVRTMRLTLTIACIFGMSAAFMACGAGNGAKGTTQSFVLEEDGVRTELAGVLLTRDQDADVLVVVVDVTNTSDGFRILPGIEMYQHGELLRNEHYFPDAPEMPDLYKGIFYYETAATFLPGAAVRVISCYETLDASDVELRIGKKSATIKAQNSPLVPRKSAFSLDGYLKMHSDVYSDTSGAATYLLSDPELDGIVKKGEFTVKITGLRSLPRRPEDPDTVWFTYDFEISGSGVGEYMLWEYLETVVFYGGVSQIYLDYDIDYSTVSDKLSRGSLTMSCDARKKGDSLLVIAGYKRERRIDPLESPVIFAVED